MCNDFPGFLDLTVCLDMASSKQFSQDNQLCEQMGGRQAGRQSFTEFKAKGNITFYSQCQMFLCA